MSAAPDNAFPQVFEIKGPSYDPIKGKAVPLGTSEVYVQPGLSKREHAAIALRVPDSGNDWLDAMIRTAQRNDLAARAINGLAIHLYEQYNDADNAVARSISAVAYQAADAMLSASAAHSAEGE